MANTLTLVERAAMEQPIVDHVRLQLSEREDKLADSKVAGAMVIARHAHRAGRNSRSQDTIPDPELLIRAELPRTKDLVTGVETTEIHEVYKRTFNTVMQDDKFSAQALWAFEQGRKDG